MQTPQPGDNKGSGLRDDTEVKGILESPNGVVSIYNYGELIARCFDYKKTYHDGIYRLVNEDVEHHIEWDCWSFGEIRWSHKAALMFLQGSSMQQLVMPYLLLRAHPMPPYEPQPGAYEVVMAELHVAPEPALDHRTMFSLLAPDAHRLSRKD